MRIALLASGGLGLEVLKQLYAEGRHLAAILTDKQSGGIREFCAQQGLPVFAGNPRGQKCPFPQTIKVDVLLSVNYLFLIEEDLINWPELLPVNIHGSLLPKYRGRTPHVWAIINNEKQTGITAHVIDQGCDTGDILLQKIIPITETDTGATMLAKYAEVYPVMVRELLQSIENNTYQRVKQQTDKATYFGKRTPDDGQLNWDWQKERIYNWVRAQAHPYPGAFTFCNGNKITIDQISFSDHGFTDSQPNGLVLAVSPKPVIKTPNGAVTLEQYRERDIQIQKDDILR